MKTIVSLKPGPDPDIARVELSDGALFSFRVCYLPGCAGAAADAELPWTAGDDLPADLEEAFLFASECLRAERAALLLAARAEQCRAGLEAKLGRKGCSREAVRAVLDRLAGLGIVDDSRYARLWLAGRVRRGGHGPRALAAALRSRGISRGDAEGALRAALPPDAELALLRRCIAKKGPFGGGGDGGPGVTDGDVQAAKYFLKGEGFSAAVIELWLEEEDLA